MIVDNFINFITLLIILKIKLRHVHFSNLIFNITKIYCKLVIFWSLSSQIAQLARVKLE